MKTWTREDRRRIRERIVQEHRAPRTTPRPDLLHIGRYYEDLAPPDVVQAVELGLQAGAREPDGGEGLAREAVRLVLSGATTPPALAAVVGKRRTPEAAKDLRAFLKEKKA